MPTMQTQQSASSQCGYTGPPWTGTYAVGGGDMSFASDLMMFVRFPTELPLNATVNSATLTFQLIAKQDVAQSAVMSVQSHQSGDSPKLVVGAAEGSARWGGSYRMPWNPSWLDIPADANGNKIVTLDVATIVREAVYRSDWKPGGYITLMIYCDNENGSDMGIRANNDFAQKPTLNVDWSYGGARKTQINLLENSQFSTDVDSLDPASPLPYWAQNAFYGAMVDPANYGTIARSGTTRRVAGVEALQFTTGTPPSPADGKATGPHAITAAEGGVNYIFNGWLFIPGNVTEQVTARSAYTGGVTVITARDQWVPFCVDPVGSGGAPGTWGALWWAIGIGGPYASGKVIYLSEPGVYRSDFKMAPFRGTQAATSRITYSTTASSQRSARAWVPRRQVKVGAAVKGASSWTKRPDGLLVLSEG